MTPDRIERLVYLSNFEDAPYAHSKRPLEHAADAALQLAQAAEEARLARAAPQHGETLCRIWFRYRFSSAGMLVAMRGDSMVADDTHGWLGVRPGALLLQGTVDGECRRMFLDPAAVRREAVQRQHTDRSAMDPDAALQEADTAFADLLAFARVLAAPAVEPVAGEGADGPAP